MKIFMSFSELDHEIAQKCMAILSKANHDVLRTDEAVNYGEVITSAIKSAIQSADVIFVILTENYLHSSWGTGLGVTILGSPNAKIFPVIIGEILLPNYLNANLFYKVPNVDAIDAEFMLEMLKGCYENEHDYNPSSTKATKRKNLDEISELKKAMNDSKLTLVCGAGTSTDSNIPNWEKLLTEILNKYIIYANTNEEIDVEELRSILPSSSLILAKYLRYFDTNNDFEKVLRECLYSKNSPNEETELLKSIVDLIRPHKHTKGVESVISFNFDSILEETLDNNRIKYKAIYDETMKPTSDETPIFHVHGYLPRNKKIENANIIFSEDSYHRQFSDPYSWSNLKQLDSYSNNVCLFVGVSLTDPNLRRLLDISKLMNVTAMSHFIIKRKPQNHTQAIVEIAMVLQEQDANMLGMNVIWVDEHSDTPALLRKIRDN